jgi:hypothetical protein
MNGLYPIPKRQRKPGAFPTADAMRAEKAAAQAVSVTPDPAVPATTAVEKPEKVLNPKKSRDDAS